MTRRLWRIVRVVVGLAAAAGITWAVVRSWPIAREHLFPRPLLFSAVTLLSLLGCLGGAASWAWLSAEPGRRARPLIAFMASQPAKYLPLGGALQFAAVVDLSTADDEHRGTMAATFVLHAVVLICAALAFGSFMALSPGLDPIRRLIAASGLLAWLVLLPSIRTLLQRVSRRGPRVLRDALSGPSLRLSGAFAWSAIPLVTAGTSFTLLLQPTPQWSDFVGIAPAWGIAWAAGFAALPFPSGVGVRELALALLLPTHPFPAIVAASLAHRTVTLVAELLLLGVTWRRAYVAPTSAPEKDIPRPSGGSQQ